MIRKSIKVSEPLYQEYMDYTDMGTADERIAELLGTQKAHNALIQERTELLAQLQQKAQRILELEEAKDNILTNQSSPDKQRRLDFDRYAFDRTLDFKTEKHKDDTAISQMDRFVSLGIQMMKQGIVTDADMRPIINIVLPKLAVMMTDVAQLDNEVSVAIEESKNVEQ